MATPTPGETGSYVNPNDQIAQRAGSAISKSKLGQATGDYGDYSTLYGPGAAQARAKFMQANQDLGNPPITIGSNELKSSYYKWSDSYRNEFRNKLALINSNWATATDGDLAKKWADLVDQSSAYLQAGQSLTAWDILNRDVSTVGTSTAKPTTQTLTSTSANYTSALDSEALFTQAAQSLLGRKPTGEEVAQFQSLLRSQEAANPVTTVTTRTTSPTGATTSERSAQTGGLSADARALLAQKQAEGSSDYAEHQAATTLMGWLAGAAAGG